MLKRFYLTAFFFIAASAAFAQTGSIKGKVLDKTSNEPLPFASVVAELNGSQVGAAQTDFDGNFTIKPLDPGKYDLKATFVGYGTAAISGVIVSIDKTTFQDVKLAKGAVDIKQVDVTAYKVPLIDRGNPATQTTITQEDIRSLPTRDVKSVAATAAGVVQKDEGDDVNIRGARSANTYYYIDGVKVRGSQQLPKSGIEQVTVIQGGVPAQYGDATGGIISITTRGPSKDFAGGINIESSQLFDDYNHLLGGFNVSGPILSKKETDGTKKPLIGFFISGELQTDDDNDPSAIGIYRIKEDRYNSLISNPLLPPITSASDQLLNAADYLTASDFENVKPKQNTDNQAYRATASIDVQPVKNVTLKLGGSGEYSKENNFSFENSLLNFDNNTQTVTTSWRAYARFTQRFGNESTGKAKSSSVIKNAYYSIQFDYSKSRQVDQSARHEDRIFDYGYVGSFASLDHPNYTYQGRKIYNPNAPGDSSSVYDQTGFTSDYVAFTPGGVNPEAQAYTSQFLTYWDPNYFNGVHDNSSHYQNLFLMQSNNAWINGDNSLFGSNKTTANTLFRTAGYNGHNFYRDVDNDQFRVSVLGSADIKNHAIMIGFEYEQRINRSYLINTPGVTWFTMISLGNQYLTRGTNTNDTLSVNYFGTGDTAVSYTFGNDYSNSGGPKGFYENLRAKLGKSNNEYVDIYALDRSVLSLDLFTPDELYGANGGPGLSNIGFDHTGKKYTGNASFDDFFNKKVDGNFTREIPAGQPIYMAGYIQDRFDFNDLSFNVGVRIDRYDANQKVLRDKYLLYPAETVGSIAASGGYIVGGVPENIGNDYVIYGSSSNANGPVTPIGYRNGDKWYDANGQYVANPLILAQSTTSGNIEPLLKPSSGDINSGNFNSEASFTDYEPQINVMPRIAFQFPISDQALFYAHYDVLTQRPIERSAMNPAAYLFLDRTATLANNPELKPEKTTEYEMGFRQTLSRSSALSISAFYRELKDMIQQINVPFADPIAYTTYDNVDFGTVKGFTLSYDLRRTGNVRLTASYTLQFADGTGSSSTSTAEIVSGNTSSSAYFRSIVPLDFDIRHNFIFNIDYRYSSGKDYNGPMLFGKQILSNTGLNILFKGTSGSPYTGQLAASKSGTIFIGTQTTQTNKVDGTINGSRLPWQFRIDLKVDKDFAIKLGKNREDKKNLMLNVYVQIQNVIDSRNIIGIYRFTGNPDDDGFLQSSLGQDYLANLNNTDAFTDMYHIKANNPDNYSLPRRIWLGLELNF